jgi:signal transduction histidine kinase
MARPFPAPYQRIQFFTAAAILLALGFGVMAWRTAGMERQRAAVRTCAFVGNASIMLTVKARLYLETVAEPIFAAVGGRAPLPSSDSLPGPDVLRAADHTIARCHCAPHLTSFAYFRLGVGPDGAPGALSVTSARLDGPAPRDQDVLGGAHLIDAVMRLVPEFHRTGVVAGGVTETPAPSDSMQAVAVVNPKFDADGRVVAIYGLLVAPDVFAREIVGPVFEHEPVFPTRLALHQGPADTAVRDRNGELANVAVLDNHWTTLYQSGPLVGPAADTPSVSLSKGCVAMAIADPALARLMIHVSPHLPVFQQWIQGTLATAYLPLLALIAAAMLASIAAAGIGARREAELARLRSDFVSNISHELRMPLAQILMSAETLRFARTRSQADHDREADSIVREAHRLTGLVDNALSFSRIEHHNLRVAPQPVDMREEIDEALGALATLATGSRATLSVTAPAEIHALIDRDSFRQVLYNLIENAIKYGPPGQEIHVGAARSDAAPGWTRVWVDDQGPGIPIGDQAVIFDPFVRLERDRTLGIAGSGLGLAVVRHLVDQHGGRIWVESGSRGKGSRFVVEIPDATGARNGSHVSGNC